MQDIDFDIDNEIANIKSDAVTDVQTDYSEQLCEVIMDCGLSIACERGIGLDVHSKFKHLKEVVKDWDGMQANGMQSKNFMLYPATIAQVCCRCYNMWKEGNDTEFANSIRTLLRRLKSYDLYWEEKIMKALDQ